MKKRYVVVIPARFESTRLPGKPLIKIMGIELLLRTYQQVLSAVNSDNIYIATDDDRISKFCRNHNMNCVMTSEDCLTGTDRVAEVALDSINADYYINVQGDEPLINPDDITKLIKYLYFIKDPEAIIAGYTDITNKEDFYNVNIPKVVINRDAELLYMSRAPIPYNKNREFIEAYRQVCIYAFKKSALYDFMRTEDKTTLEKIEDIELLRFIEMGKSVKMLRMSDKSIAVDVPQDIKKVEREITKSW